MIVENTKVDSILVKNFEGNEVDLLQAYANHNLLIIIYNNQCLGCTGRAIPLAYEFQKQFKNIQVIGIHSSFNAEEVTEKDIKSIFTIKELPFPILLDEGHKVYDKFQSEGTPQWLLIDAKGILVRSIFGSQGSAQNRLMYAIEQLEGDAGAA
ncbi:hypothetical protein DNU06_04975 [Putridiphycobacter roseus]|uniref:Alkyl hydroperoxide reductase subunit C/ Thiol specific antioxidant domain-containing protein n=1 Tax=Putridiphycobacter roseus TaxID=2219161 RepID=A0A2W1N2B8_9FLAO|nr:redoxin domain-containing protein [Putridiphycobacter roseus]PZE17974.1 hypothetical protein DNU06_04975 [Putridiphycobacter roseus]